MSSEGNAALADYAIRRGITKAQAATNLLNEYIYGIDRVPGVAPPAKRQSADSGYIYLLRNGKHYKIGKAKNADKRIKQFIPAPDTEIVFTRFVSNRHEAERLLHKRFASKRVSGEWFALSAADVMGIST